MYYVTMTDKFMSGWGRADGKINKFVICCATRSQANMMERHALTRPEMETVNVTETEPVYPKTTHLISWRNFSDMGGCWTGG